MPAAEGPAFPISGRKNGLAGRRFYPRFDVRCPLMRRGPMAGKESAGSICLTCPYSLSRITGVGRFVETLSDRLDARGAHTLIIYPEPARSQASKADRAVPLRARILRDLELSARTAWQLVRLRRRFEILQAQQAHLQSLSAILTARALGKPSVVTIHLRIATAPRPMRGRIQSIVERLTLGLAQAVVAVSPFVAESFGRSGLIVIENGVDVDRFRRSDESRQTIRAALGLGDEFVWVFAGRWSRHKGIDLLLDALGNPVLADQRFRVLLVGDRAEDEPELLERGLQHPDVRSRLQILGPVEDPSPYLSTSDAFVLPSRLEGMPLSFLEAMGCGLPVLASDIPVHRMLIEQAGCGWTFRSEDPSDLAHKMAEIMDSGIPVDWAHRAREAVVKHHSLELTVSKYEALFEQLLQRK